jgi:anti-anti-sigma factor
MTVDVPSSAPLRIIVDVAPRRLSVRLVGELDMASADALTPFLAVQLDSCVESLTVDLSELSFIDSAGVSALLQFQAKHAANARVVELRHPSTRVRLVFTILGAEDCFAA